MNDSPNEQPAAPVEKAVTGEPAPVSLGSPTPNLASQAVAPAGQPADPAGRDQPSDLGLTLEPPAKFQEAMTAAEAMGSGLRAISDTVEPNRKPAAWALIAAILRSSAVRTSLDIYKRRDDESGRQQALLKKEAFQSNLCLLAAGIISGLILAISAGALVSLAWLARFFGLVGLSEQLVSETVKSWVILILGLLTLLLGAVAAYFAYIARDQSRIVRWQSRRGEAETARLDVFLSIASQAAALAKTEPDVVLLAFAVVVRHLLNDQRNWLAARAQRHRESSEKTSRMGALASALAFVGGSGAIIASQSTAAAQGAVWIVLAGVVGAAVSAFAANREALNGDRDNAERYDKTGLAMDAIAARVDGVARTIADGKPEALEAFTKTITDLLSAENKQWQDGTARANAALDKLDEQLKQTGKAKDSGQA